MALFVVANLFGVRYLVRANSAITTWKVIIPTLTIVVLFFTHFDTSNFTSHGFAPFGLHGVLQAVSDGGAVFALVGFEQAVQLGGESRNPQRDMPRAVIFSMLIGATIYILLQVVFIGALPPARPGPRVGRTSASGIFGPFAGLAKGLGLAWLAYILYADAIIAPPGSGLIYTTTTSRITFGMSKNGHVPVAFEKTTAKNQRPRLRPDLHLPDGPAALPPLPRVAEAGRLHHLGHRPHVRRRPPGPRRPAPPEARRRPALPAAVGGGPGSGSRSSRPA
jgi:amino acid transporter